MMYRWVAERGSGSSLCVVALAAVMAVGCGDSGSAGETTTTTSTSAPTTAVTSVSSTGEPGTTGDVTTGETPTGGNEGSATGTTSGDGSTSSAGSTGDEGTTAIPDPVCGDAVLDPGEGCDDGEMNADDGACTSQCVPATCGDLLVQTGVEECDDGNQVDTDACVAGCKHAVCGDGLIGPGELCDDGNQNDDDSCTNACASPNCGDGKLQMAQGEECDDGNALDTDACLGTCVAAKCGDSKVQAGVEECDDGNADAADMCTAACKQPTCSDGAQNGAETDVDCGGSCGKCGLGKACVANTDCGMGLCIAGSCAVPKSCKQIKEAAPASKDGNYSIDPDGPGPIGSLVARCDMDADMTCGYTWIRYDDPALLGDQNAYAAKCAAVGMEVIVTRTKPHAQAVYDWNLSQNANLVNVFPKVNGAAGINNWQGICQGAPCSFWMTDNINGDVGCTNFEPNGDNNVAFRIYLRQAGCGLQGNWNDANNAVAVQGWVICSPNDC